MKTIIYIFFVLILFSACGGGAPRDGETTYRQTCAACHGLDGLGQVSGAKQLAKSILTEDSIVQVIRQGRGAMPARLLMNDQEIQAVAKYILTLRK